MDMFTSYGHFKKPAIRAFAKDVELTSAYVGDVIFLDYVTFTSFLVKRLNQAREVLILIVTSEPDHRNFNFMVYTGAFGYNWGLSQKN